MTRPWSRNDFVHSVSYRLTLPFTLDGREVPSKRIAEAAAALAEAAAEVWSKRGREERFDLWCRGALDEELAFTGRKD